MTLCKTPHNAQVIASLLVFQGVDSSYYVEVYA